MNTSMLILTVIFTGSALTCLMVTFYKRLALRKALRLTPSLLSEEFTESSTDDIVVKKKPTRTKYNLNYQSEATALTSSTAAKPYEDASKLITLHIMAREGQVFKGYELLQSLLSCGLRFGKMKIFHRYENFNGKGKLLFSLACCTSPGTFEIHQMRTFSCNGLSLFMDIAYAEDPNAILKLLLNTACQIAEDLNGVLKNSRFENLTEDMVNSYYQKIKNHLESNQPLPHSCGEEQPAGTHVG